MSENQTAKRIDAKGLIKKWKVDVRHGLYNRDGKWFHLLKEFPGAFFDATGYIVFDSQSDYEKCKNIIIYNETNTTSVPDGISQIPGYIYVSSENIDDQRDTELLPPEGSRRFLALSGGEKVEFEEGERLSRENRYFQRISKLAREAKRRHGTTCMVCEFDFAKIYGEIGFGFIECHHLNPLSERAVDSGVRQLKTTLDEVAVVCANCHRMIHSSRPALSLEAVRRHLATASNKTRSKQ